jgi:C1A family cysteine protease
MNWADQGAVTPARDQGTCGDCWAFSTAAFFESELIRRTYATKTIMLAPQFFYQCDLSSEGCSGGYLSTAMDLGLTKGIPFEANYPYSPAASYPTVCSAVDTAKIFNSTRITFTSGLSDAQIISYLIERPLNVGVSAVNW